MASGGNVARRHATGTPFRLGVVLGDDGSHLGQVEDLSDFFFDHLSVGEIVVATRTALGCVGHDVVGTLHRFEAMSVGAGLLAGTSASRRAIGRHRGFGEPLGRRRQGGILRVASKGFLEFRDAGREQGDRGVKLRDLVVSFEQETAQMLDFVLVLFHEGRHPSD